MLELGTDELAKYPFLEGAGKFLKEIPILNPS
jgi:hypothetical protein